MNEHNLPRGPLTRVRRQAFTLAELAAVVVCVGLLIAIVEPSLDAARERSKSAVCLEHMRAIGAASNVYMENDPNGLGIPVHERQSTQDPADPTFIGAYEWGGKSGIGRPGFVDGPSEGEFAYISSKYGTKAGFGPATRPLNDILYPHGFRDNLYPFYDRAAAFNDTQLVLDAYRCPADDGPAGGGHCPDWVINQARSSYDHFGNSYAANLFMTGSSSGGEMLSNSPYLRPVSRVPNPARTINYEENIGRWAWACRREIDDCQWIGPGVDPGPTKAIRGWHGKDWTFNHAYVDGHVGTRKIYVEGTEDAEGYANHYYNELVFDDPQQQEYNRCIIIRGRGWQKDTLPDDPIPTGLMTTGQGRPSYEDCVGY
jgi:hypothetical protein